VLLLTFYLLPDSMSCSNKTSLNHTLLGQFCAPVNILCTLIKIVQDSDSLKGIHLVGAILVALPVSDGPLCVILEKLKEEKTYYEA
jgi:hypothetical protein